MLSISVDILKLPGVCLILPGRRPRITAALLLLLHWFAAGLSLFLTAASREQKRKTDTKQDFFCPTRFIHC